MAESPTGANPGNQAGWVKHSQDNMMHARNMIRDMLTVVRNNEIAEAANKDAAMEADKREKEEKKAKVVNQAAAHEKVIATSFQCMQDIEDAILQTEDSLSKLTHERYKGFAFLQVCERRQELREKRPPSEHFKDALTDALVSERNVLENARKELQALEQSGKEIVELLRDKRAFLSRDTGERRLQMMEDLKTLSPENAVSLPVKKQATSPKAGGGGDAPAEGGETNAEAPPSEQPPPHPSHALSPEEQKKAEAASKELIQATIKLLDSCAKHRQKSLETVVKCKQAANAANHRTEDCLSRRTGELAEMKKQLEKHALDVEAAITRAERSLDRSERRLDSSNKSKVDKMEADKKMLNELRAIRTRLAEDIRNKFAALEIDNMCRRVTAAKASEAKMKAAMMTRTNSAPALGRKKTGASPSGASNFGETGMTDSTAAPSEDSHRPPSNSTGKLPPLSPGGSKSLKAGGQQSLAQ